MTTCLALSARIKKELKELERVVDRFDLDKEQIAPLIRNLRPTFESAQEELTRFAEALRQIGNQ